MLLDLTRSFRPWSRRLVWTIPIAAVAAAGEAAAMMAIVPLAHRLTSVEGSALPALGPLQLELGTGALVAVAAVGIVVSAAAQLASVVLRAHLMSGWEAETRERLFGAFLRTGWPVQSRERGGHLQQISGFVGSGATALGQLGLGLVALASLTVLLVAAAVVEIRAAALILGLGAALFAVLRPLATRARNLSRAHGTAMVSLGVELEAGVRAAREIRLHDAAGPVLARFGDQVRHSRVLRRRSVALTGAVTPLYRSLGLLLVVALLWLVSSQTVFEPVAFGSVALLVLRAVSYGQQLQNVYVGLVDQRGRLELLDETLAVYRRGTPPDGDRVLEAPLTVDLVGVAVGYGDGTAALTVDALHIAPGERIGVVGPSGGGKSTLAALLVRLLEPSAGVHMVNGLDAGRFTADSWARRVALVPQHTELVHGTVADNVAFGRPWVDRAAVADAVGAAGLDGTVAALPLGIDTLIGPGTRALSGGQTQRLGIARALAGGPSLLVLDEPTSALDPDTERIVTDTVAALDRGVTIVVVAHRHATVEGCDRIIRVEDGRLARVGRPAEVLTAGA